MNKMTERLREFTEQLAVRSPADRIAKASILVADPEVQAFLRRFNDKARELRAKRKSEQS